jgi:hypothetical protein
MKKLICILSVALIPLSLFAEEPRNNPPKSESEVQAKRTVSLEDFDKAILDAEKGMNASSEVVKKIADMEANARKKYAVLKVQVNQAVADGEMSKVDADTLHANMNKMLEDIVLLKLNAEEQHRILKDKHLELKMSRLVLKIALGMEKDVTKQAKTLEEWSKILEDESSGVESEMPEEERSSHEADDKTEDLRK